MNALAVVAVSLVLGGMAFFSFVMAPLVFRVLERETAAVFMRAAFPLYYAVMAVAAALGALFAAFGNMFDAILLAAVAAIFVALRQILAPAIERARNGRSAGDETARENFRRLHGLSVAVNLAQLVAVTAALLRLIR
ncbi:MAG: DUF4149 domain-containing protein [Alphaproteobacteria bacterium]